jgi:hypothetical protein
MRFAVSSAVLSGSISRKDSFIFITHFEVFLVYLGYTYKENISKHHTPSGCGKMLKLNSGSSAEVKNAWNYTSTPPYVSMVCG